MREARKLDTEQAAARLLDAHDQLLGFVRKRVANPDLAEDILQDSLLKALRAAPELRDADRLIPWFYSILQRAIVDAYRRRGRDQKLLVAESPVEPSIEPEDEAVLCECFHALIPALKPEYAELIQAMDLGAESPEAAAQRLGITPNNLKVRHHRARQALRQRLEETCRTCATHGCLDCTCART
jgi:RNA polymerase sigma factor (sigma-70 family)